MGTAGCEPLDKHSCMHQEGPNCGHTVVAFPRSQSASLAFVSQLFSVFLSKPRVRDEEEEEEALVNWGFTLAALTRPTKALLLLREERRPRRKWKTRDEIWDLRRPTRQQQLQNVCAVHTNGLTYTHEEEENPRRFKVRSERYR